MRLRHWLRERRGVRLRVDFRKAMKLISIDGELEVAGINARMKRLLAKINETEDRKTLKLLCREWWRCWFAINRPRKETINVLETENRSPHFIVRGSNASGRGMEGGDRAPIQPHYSAQGRGELGSAKGEEQIA